MSTNLFLVEDEAGRFTIITPYTLLAAATSNIRRGNLEFTQFLLDAKDETSQVLMITVPGPVLVVYDSLISKGRYLRCDWPEAHQLAFPKAKPNESA